MAIDVLDITEKIASIGTAIVAISAYAQFQWTRWNKKTALEDYLAEERPGKRSSGDKGRRTILHLVAELGFSEDDILTAAFSSKKIKRTTGQDPETKRADCIYLEYIRPAPPS